LSTTTAADHATPDPLFGHPRLPIDPERWPGAFFGRGSGGDRASFRLSTFKIDDFKIDKCL
jgi:hypothetical protein